ncbi:hypothetical protein B1987_11790 [Mycobacterium kansasii]|nr:hypothetical protein B1987_11790 [Mycobacterium kansasii]
MIGLTGNNQVGINLPGLLNSGSGNIGIGNSGTNNIGCFNSGSGNFGVFNTGANTLTLWHPNDFGFGNSGSNNAGLGNSWRSNPDFWELRIPEHRFSATRESITQVTAILAPSIQTMEIPDTSAPVGGIRLTATRSLGPPSTPAYPTRASTTWVTTCQASSMPLGAAVLTAFLRLLELGERRLFC